MKHAHEGIVLVIKNSLVHEVMNLCTNFQALNVSFENSKSILMCCLYLPPNLMIEKQNIQNIIDQLPTAAILTSD